MLATKNPFEKIAIHSLLCRMLSKLIFCLLKRNDEVAFLDILKIFPHAIIKVFGPTKITLSIFGNKFKCFPHAIFYHLFFCLAKFLKFTSQNLESSLNRAVSLWKIEWFCFKRAFFEIWVLDEKLNHSSLIN